MWKAINRVFCFLSFLSVRTAGGGVSGGVCIRVSLYLFIGVLLWIAVYCLCLYVPACAGMWLGKLIAVFICTKMSVCVHTCICANQLNLFTPSFTECQFLLPTCKITNTSVCALWVWTCILASPCKNMIWGSDKHACGKQMEYVLCCISEIGNPIHNKKYSLTLRRSLMFVAYFLEYKLQGESENKNQLLSFFCFF